MIIAELIREGRDRLVKAGVLGADLDCLLLLGHCLNMSRTELYLNGGNHVEKEPQDLFFSLIDRRVAREPVAYILQEREFWSLNFFVNNHVLIPRPETEFLLESVFQYIKPGCSRIKNCIDLCCGSGVIAVVLARELKRDVLAIDRSYEALNITDQNALRHGVDARVFSLCSDLFAAVKGEVVASLIVSNPPYVRADEIAGELEPEVALFEPELALDGGADGLECIRRIADEILFRLEPSGYFFMEFGAEQGEEVKKIFAKLRSCGRFFERLDILQDYSGRDRVLAAQINDYAG